MCGAATSPAKPCFRLYITCSASSKPLLRLYIACIASSKPLLRLYTLAVHRRSLFCDYTRLQCIVEAFFATITCNHVGKRVDFAGILAILSAKEARTVAYLAAMSAEKGLNGGMLEWPDARFKPNMGMERWVCGEDVRAGGVIFIICRYCNLL